MKRNFGLTTTLFLQYDLIFLLLIIDSELDIFSYQELKDGRCLFPFKKVNCLDESLFLEQLSGLALFVVYTYYLDKRIDGEDYKLKDKLAYKLVKLKGAENFKQLENTAQIKDKLIAGMKLEEQEEYSPEHRISLICNLYADLVVDNLDLADLKLDYHQIAFNMCQIMYYLDALEDYKTDKQQGKANILFSLDTELENIIAYVKNKLMAALAEIKAELLFDKNREIIENIIELNLQTVFNKFKKELLA